MFTPEKMNQIKGKFYQYDVEYKKFNDVTKERLEEIKKDIKNFENRILNDTYKKKTFRLDRYYRILAYLSTKRDYTYDEKVAFVLLSCDPDLAFYKGYKSLDFQSSAKIEAMEDPEEQLHAKEYNNLLFAELAAEVRIQIGFYEPKLLKYEEAFFKKFTRELIPYSGKDYGNILFKLPHDFTQMTPAEYLFCKLQVSRYLSKVENIDIKTAIYHILFQPELLRLFSNEQRLLFFILAVDPELEFYQIYLDECTWNKIEARSKDEKGYFNENLYIVEKDYFKAFQPEDIKKKLW